MFTSLAARVSAVALSLFMAIGPLVILGAGPASDDPLLAPYVDNQIHTLDANSNAWFKFDYGTGNSLRTMVLVTLENGAQSGLRLEVWAPEVIRQWTDKQPTGKGTVAAFDCVTGQVVSTGQCLASDLTWTGAFGSIGTYFVRIINDTPSARTFRLMVLGAGVTLGAPSATSAGEGTATPSVSPQTATPSPVPTPLTVPVVVDDPSQAVSIDGQPHLIPGKSATWYRFDYVESASSPRPVVSLRLKNGVVTGVGFQVWAPEHIGEWLQKKPVGRGTQEVVVNCRASSPDEEDVLEGQPTPTPLPPSPDHCPTNDLTWAGAFGGLGVYYVRVVNENMDPMEYELILQQP